MHALEVQRNGETLAVVGASNALMFAAHVNAAIEEAGATLDLRGMLDLGDERTSHVSWLQLSQLQRGDLLNFRFFESEVVSSPRDEVATDSEEHIAEQAEFEEELKSNPPAPRYIEARQPDVTLLLNISGNEPITATLESGRQFIAFRVLWNQWSPERCRLSLSSFSQQEGLARTGGKDWFQGTLEVGDQCAVKIGA